VSLSGPAPQTTELQIPNPALGSDFSFQPSLLYRVRLCSLLAMLVCDAVVATRQVSLVITTAAGVIINQRGSAANVTASHSQTFAWARYAGASGTTSAGSGGFAPDGVPDWWLPPGAIIKSVTSALDPGDQWSELFAVYETSWRAGA
jgi:hypothetical protein